MRSAVRQGGNAGDPSAALSRLRFIPVNVGAATSGDGDGGRGEGFAGGVGCPSRQVIGCALDVAAEVPSDLKPWSFNPKS